MNDNCELCYEVTSDQLPEHYKVGGRSLNRATLRFGTARAVPAITPLREGHFLVMPFRHVTASSQLHGREREDLLTTMTYLARHARSLGAQLFVFEHGIGRHETGGCGVSHAHLHSVLVNRGECDRCLDAITALEGPQTMVGRSLPTLDTSYVYALDWAGKRSVAITGQFQSQTLRRLVAAELGSEFADWRRIENWTAFSATERHVAAMKTCSTTWAVAADAG